MGAKKNWGVLIFFSKHFVWGENYIIDLYKYILYQKKIWMILINIFLTWHQLSMQNLQTCCLLNIINDGNKYASYILYRGHFNICPLNKIKKIIKSIQILLYFQRYNFLSVFIVKRLLRFCMMYCEGKKLISFEIREFGIFEINVRVNFCFEGVVFLIYREG